MNADGVLAAFGGPVYELVAQPRVFCAGWDADDDDEVVGSVSARYLLARVSASADEDAEGLRPRGRVLRCEVTTERAGFTAVPADPVRAALESNLAFAVINDHRTDDQHEWIELVRRSIDAVRGAEATPGQLAIDGVEHVGLQARHGSFRATAVRLDDRVVTLTVHDDDAHELALELRRVS